MHSDELDRTIARAKLYLCARRSLDGLWREFGTLAGEAVDWPSGYILDALYLAEADRDLLTKSAIVLMSRQHSDGGWGYHFDVPTDADSTAAVLLFLNRLRIFPEIAHKAAQCLLRFQHESGGIATYQDDTEIRRYLRVGLEVDFRGWCQPCCEVTARAGRALLSTGPEYEQAASNAWKFVENLRIDNGRWESYWWASEFVASSEAAALASALGKEHALGGMADRAAEQIMTSSEACAFVSSHCLQVLLSSCRDSWEYAGAIDYFVDHIAAQQAPNGGWKGSATLRIPPPQITSPANYGPWHRFGPGTGVTTRDHYSLFTTATVLAALVSVRKVHKQRH